MAQGDWTAEEAKATQEAVEEIYKALSKPKQRDFLGHLNDIYLFLARAEKELAVEVAEDEGVASEQYEYIRAIVEDGALRWEYKLRGGRNAGMAHDEDVAGWTDEQIRKLTKAFLSVEGDDPVRVKVEHR
jgi:hypothetical protein